MHILFPKLSHTVWLRSVHNHYLILVDKELLDPYVRLGMELALFPLLCACPPWEKGKGLLALEASLRHRLTDT